MGAHIELGLRRPEAYAVLLMGPRPDTISDDDLDQLPGALAPTMTAEPVAEVIAAGELRPDLDLLATAVTPWPWSTAL